MTQRNSSKSKTDILLLVVLATAVYAGKRPIYIIANSINAVSQIQEPLDLGANGIETGLDIYNYGSMQKYTSRTGCCPGHICHSHEVVLFFESIRNMTDPSYGNYSDKMLLHFLNLNLYFSENKTETGWDVARHVMDHLWSPDGDREQEVRVVINISGMGNSDVILAVINEFTDRGSEARLKDVGFNAGEGNVTDICDRFSDLEVTENICLGGGITGCFNITQGEDPPVDDSDDHTEERLWMRDTQNCSAKVYRVTRYVEDSLRTDVDALIVIDVEEILEAMQEQEFENKYRLATIDDDPFVRFNDE